MLRRQLIISFKSTDGALIVRDLASRLRARSPQVAKSYRITFRWFVFNLLPILTRLSCHSFADCSIDGSGQITILIAVWTLNIVTIPKMSHWSTYPHWRRFSTEPEAMMMRTTRIVFKHQFFHFRWICGVFVSVDAACWFDMITQCSGRAVLTRDINITLQN